MPEDKRENNLVLVFMVLSMVFTSMYEKSSGYRGGGFLAGV